MIKAGLIAGFFIECEFPICSFNTAGSYRPEIHNTVVYNRKATATEGAP
ncbi:MAG: hypothetical protein IPL59_11940 [Candidatus Competibacteraceae bacterium]|nr:hypothetical protein [Candidatus Competibacteraceae bacterium]MBK8755172.1 hypothetical protein [Candidatus Competibacteraceae bacterium]